MKQPLKILYISHSAQLAGAELCLFNLLKHMDRQRFAPVIVFPEEGPLKEKIDLLGLKTYTTPLEWWVGTEGGINLTNSTLAERVQTLKAIITAESPDLVHTNTSVVFEGAIAAAEAGIPHVWHIHEILDGHPSLKPLLPFVLFYKVLAALTHSVVAVSHGARRELSRYLPMEKISVIHNGIEPGRVGESETDLRAELGLPPTAILAVNVAAISLYKGQEYLIRAAALAARENQDLHFLLVGSATPPRLEAITSLALELGVSEHIHYLGHRTDIPHILAHADLFVLPSVKEAFPLVVLEAMAADLPVVATNCCGPDEMLEEGVTGFIVPLKDPASLAARIVQLAESPEQRRQMGEKGRLAFEEYFSIEPYVAAFARLYESMDNGTVRLVKDDMVEAIIETNENMVEQIKVSRKLAAEKSALTREKAVLAGEKAALTARAEGLATELKDVYSSRSWKVTQPLRRLADLKSGTSKDGKR